MVRNKAVCLVLSVARDGTKDILGFWIGRAKGAQFWLRVMTEPGNRGIGDLLCAA
ncbi:MAG: transposase [Burkholderiales bacterium]|nr:transposase [Burkholderiales bacterium]